MAFQPTPDVAGVRLQGVMDGQLTINDLYFQISGGGINAAGLVNLATNVADWWTLNVVPLLSEDFASVRVVCVDLGSDIGPIGEAPAAATGGVAVEAVPNNVAACVSFRTAQRGRSGRGRNYVPGIPGSQVALNTLQPTFITNLVAAYELLVGAGTFIPGWQWGVVSRQTGGALRTNGLFIPITSVLMVGSSVRSMRSREIGHGA
jgi:hypothetical protein